MGQRFQRTTPRLVATLCVAFTTLAWGRAVAADGEAVVADDFERGAARWQPTDASAWKVQQLEGNQVYSLHKQSDYKPPHRSPANISLLRDTLVGDFVLTAKVQSTSRDYPHRSMCMFFGYQDAAHFYYVHFGQRTDEHANQIFIVDESPRTKISTKTTKGTPWDNEWHDVKVVRDVAQGTIDVYFDNMETPIMRAVDKTFTWGQVGLGSFDDTGRWDDVRLKAVRVVRP